MVADHPIPQMETNNLKHCFILGILHRSGTNYLYRLLREHPECAGPGPIWEDFFVHNIDMIQNYLEDVQSEWDYKKWGVEQIMGPLDTMRPHLGNGIKQLLDKQLSYSNEKPNPKVLLTKTPSVRNIDKFFEFFPYDHLIIIVRDGRSLTESGVRSFGWNYERAMRKWARGAKAILDLINKYQGADKKLLLLRYEDIFQDEERELRKVFKFLDVNPDLYKYESTKHLGVTGSSELKGKEGKVHWKITEKDEDFDPRKRFGNWSNQRHNRFKWIAGNYMKELGYELAPMPSNAFFKLRNKLLDRIWDTIESLLQSKVILKVAKKLM